MKLITSTNQCSPAPDWSISCRNAHCLETINLEGNSAPCFSTINALTHVTQAPHMMTRNITQDSMGQ